MPGNIAVVLVDDAADVRRVVRTQLQLSGRFRVVGEGASGAEAIELATALHPDVMVLDASMPDMDGLEALPVIRERSPQTHVVMLSGFSSSALSQAARLLGAADFVEKGASMRELPRRLLRLVESGGKPEANGDPQAEDRAGESVMARHLERFRAVFDRGAIGMATMTLTGTIVRANSALCRMLDVSEQQIVGRRFASLAASAEHQAVGAAIAEVGSGVRPVADVEHTLKDAPERCWHSTFAAVQDDDGAPLYLFAQADDITERRLAERQLRQSNERLRLLVESVRDYAIFMLDPNGHISSWNQGAERLKGYRAEEIIGSHFRVFYPKEAQLARHPEHELEIATREGRYEEEGWRVRKDGSRFWANVIITALWEDDELVGFAKVTRDVTERREANLKLQAAAEQTAQFLAMTVHELRTPLAVISGAISLLKEHWHALEEGERNDTLESLDHASSRLQSLVDDLLLAARLEAGSFEFAVEPMSVAAAIDEAVEATRDRVEGVTVSCPPELTVLADHNRTVQILNNLFANAGIYGTPPIHIEVTSEHGRIELRIHDSGTIDEAFVPRMFEKFSQAHPVSRQGTGLGLYIVRELARGQGGDAWYERSPAGSTCFVVALPALPRY